MAITVQPYTEDMVPAVCAFNRVLEAGTVPSRFRFPESSVPAWLPHVGNRHIYQQYYLAVEGDAVRGGFILKYQDFSIGAQIRRIAYYHLPLSQGIVNRAYAGVGVMMLRSALKLEPVLFALGMGGFDNPLPLMLKAMKWKLTAVPFFFRVIHPGLFLREISALKRSPTMRLGAQFASRTGVGWFMIHAAQRFRQKAVNIKIQTDLISEFGSWSDDLWRECSSAYAFIGSRDSATLNMLYPHGKNFFCLRVTRDSSLLGWAVLLNTQMHRNKYFGNLCVGSIVDCLAAPQHAECIVQTAAEFLVRQGCDLIVTNHTHGQWGLALTRSGFLSGPSNFVFAPSPALADALGPTQGISEIFLTRGDGDGPVNL